MPVSGPANELQFTVILFHQRGATFDPIAVIIISNPSKIANFSMVDMPTNDAINAALDCSTRDRFFILADKLHGVFNAHLHIG